MSNFKTLYDLESELFTLECAKQGYERQIKEIKQKNEQVENTCKDDLISWKDVGHKGVIVENIVYGLKWNPPKPIVTDESKLPDRFFKIKKELSKSLVNQAIKDGEQLEGVALDNGSYSLTRTAKERG